MANINITNRTFCGLTAGTDGRTYFSNYVGYFQFANGRAPVGYRNAFTNLAYNFVRVCGDGYCLTGNGTVELGLDANGLINHLSHVNNQPSCAGHARP